MIYMRIRGLDGLRGKKMDRRRLIGLTFAGIFYAGVAAAAGIEDHVISQLTQDGYFNITVEKTWLGRVRIVAQTADGMREIILNPVTGEILRDLWTASDGGSASGTTLIKDGSTKPPTSGNGSGSSASSDDGESDNKDGDDEEDNDNDNDDNDSDNDDDDDDEDDDNDD